MDEQEASKKSELAKSVVGRHCSLRALKTIETDANVRLLDHGDVVGSIANRQRHRIAAFFDLERFVSIV